MKHLCTSMRLGAFLFLLFLPSMRVATFAQANSDLTGIVTDQSGAVVAGAKIVLTDPATEITKATNSGSTGLYHISGLNPASYNMRVALKGFQTFGEDFLEQFDMLIDNAHSLLCLDDSAAMRADVKGLHIALLTTTQTSDGEPLPKSLIVSARLSDGMRPVRLKLDSGTNIPFLYNTSEYMALGAFRGAALRGGANGAQRTFTALPPQNLKIGSVEMQKVSFITLVGARKDSRTSGFDGLLTMGLFKRVFISHSDHFAVLDPW